MSYCVNCGVELEKSARRCPLCNTPVVNPAQPPADDPPAYPEDIYIPKSTRSAYTSFIFTIVMVIPNIVCGVINLFYPSTGHWAVYVISVSALLWIFFILPFILKTRNPYVLLALDAAASLLFTFVMSVFHGKAWFLTIALPAILILAALLAGMIYWLNRKKREWPSVCTGVVGLIGVMSLVFEFLISWYLIGRPIVRYSVIIVASCICLIVFFEFAGRNKRFRAWLTRRFYV